MKTEIFLENEQLDISTDLSALLTLAIDDVRDFSSRQTSFSKTIVLPGTAKNNRVFGHIYDVGQANVYDGSKPNFGYNFNASKSAACIIFQDNIQTFKGVLRILQINIINGRIEYEASVFGDLLALNTQLSSKLLQDLDFSEYDHTLSLDAITNSWDNEPGSGYYYPLIDHGNYSADKHNWDYHTFRPALYVAEYLAKMFAEAGFRYSSPLFDTERFRRLIIPYNQKVLTKLAAGGSTLSEATNAYITGSPVNDVGFHTITGSGFTADTTGVEFTYVGATANIDVIVGVNGQYQPHTGQAATKLVILKNGMEVTNTEIDYASTYFSISVNYSTTINPNDVIRYKITSTAFNLLSGHATITTAAASVAQIPVNIGDTVTINNCIAKNIRQIDFLVSIIKLFNLYVVEDKFDHRLVHISPFVDFYDTDTTKALDWSYKLNRNQLISLKPMSELNSKTYSFNYKSDSDYYNDLYAKRYGQGYGSYIFDSAFDFAQQTNKLELIFAATPLVGWDTTDKVYSTIFKQSGSGSDIKEEQVDSAIRILQSKKLTGLTSWNIKNGGSVLNSYTYYGYAGHLDDPDAPANDLNFGAVQELFFILTSGTLSNTQFNLYWSSYMAEITDKDSKLLTASFYLTSADIYNLDFSKYITVDGVLFRLNKISDYNLSNPGECQVELLKVNYTLY